MKRLRYFIVLIAALTFTASSYAEDPKAEPVFAHLVNKDNSNEHSYMSGMMLKKMGTKDGMLKGVPVKSLKSVELISMKYNADSYLNPVKKKLVDDMELYGASNTNNGMYSEIYVKSKDGGKTFEKLLVINWGRWRTSAKALYMVGEIPADKVDFDNL